MPSSGDRIASRQSILGLGQDMLTFKNCKRKHIQCNCEDDLCGISGQGRCCRVILIDKLILGE